MTLASHALAAQTRTPVRTATHRPRAVCPACQHPKPIRANGRMAKHRDYTKAWCDGAGLTPIPVRVRVPNYSKAGVLDGKLLDRWDFLAQPLVTLLHITRAKVCEVAEPGFAGSIRAVPQGITLRWIVRMPVDGDALQHDLVVRRFLAAAHGIDVSDWPVGMS